MSSLKRETLFASAHPYRQAERLRAKTPRTSQLLQQMLKLIGADNSAALIRCSVVGSTDMRHMVNLIRGVHSTGDVVFQRVCLHYVETMFSCVAG